MFISLPDFSLNLEQEFALRKYQQLAQSTTREELEDVLIRTIYANMSQENLIRGLICEQLKSNS